MATSSIFADFTIKKTKNIRSFVNACEKSMKTPSVKGTAPSCHFLASKKDFAKFSEELLSKNPIFK